MSQTKRKQQRAMIFCPGGERGGVRIAQFAARPSTTRPLGFTGWRCADCGRTLPRGVHNFRHVASKAKEVSQACD